MPLASPVRDRAGGEQSVDVTQGSMQQALVAERAQVQSLHPPHSGAAVASGRACLEIHFDRPMTPAIHIFGAMPEITGAPVWDDDGRVLRIPVSLSAHTSYRLLLNIDTGEGFRSVTGEPLAPQEWLFDVR